MSKDLTSSNIDRKNILNNKYALQEMYEQLGIPGLMFDGKYRYTRQQVARYFEVDIRTIERLLETHREELEQTGYELLTGFRLRQFKETAAKASQPLEDDPDIDVGIIPEASDNQYINLEKAARIGLFTFKGFLNLGMLLTGSEKAQQLRSAILDIVIDLLNKRLGGQTKYINQREEEFLPSALREHHYRQEFTNALDFYIDANKFKYGQLTDKIYTSIFRENAKEYRQILNLNVKESVRSTMYSEVLDLIASYENGFAQYLRSRSEALDRKLSLSEAHRLFAEFERSMDAFVAPLREKARSLMASRDLAFREALHEKLKEYVNAVSTEDYERFLGASSAALEQRLEDNKEVFIRLKDR